MSNIPFRSDQLVDELVQFNQNLSKGVKNLLDAEEISAGVTPREEVYAEDKLKLYRYQPSTGVVQNKIPTLIVYALVNRPYMADIQENRSTIKGLLDIGHIGAIDQRIDDKGWNLVLHHAGGWLVAIELELVFRIDFFARGNPR